MPSAPTTSSRSPWALHNYLSANEALPDGLHRLLAGRQAQHGPGLQPAGADAAVPGAELDLQRDQLQRQPAVGRRPTGTPVQTAPLNGSTADCDSFGCMNATATANQINSFLCPSDTDLANLTYFIFSPGGTQQLVGRHNYPMNGGTNPFSSRVAGFNGVCLLPNFYAGTAQSRRASAMPSCRAGKGPASFLQWQIHAEAPVDHRRPSPTGRAIPRCLQRMGPGRRPPTAGASVGVRRTAKTGSGRSTSSTRSTSLNSQAAADEDLPDCPDLRSSRRAVQQYTWKGDWWITDMFSYSHTQTPNRRSCWYSDVGGRPWSGAASVVAASSRHPGGVNIAFCDGSVKFIKSSVDSRTWDGARDEERRRGLQRRRVLMLRRVRRYLRPAGSTRSQRRLTPSRRRSARADLAAVS